MKNLSVEPWNKSGLQHTQVQIKKLSSLEKLFKTVLNNSCMLNKLHCFTHLKFNKKKGCLRIKNSLDWTIKLSYFDQNL